MTVKFIVHEAEEDGHWAEALAIPGWATQGEALEELMKNVQQATEGCPSTTSVQRGRAR